MKYSPLIASLLLLSTHALADGFELKDTPGQFMDVLVDGKVAARYMYACDKSDAKKRHETYKPYLHIFDAQGKAPITKGPGGEYTHHRGIFIGWIRIGYNGKTYDRWGMGGKGTAGEIIHQKFLEQKADAQGATITVLTHWNDETGKPMVAEERTMKFTRAPAPFRVQVDFAAKLTAPNGDLLLGGDPEHGGVQYRPAEEMDRAKTTYVFPKESADAHKDTDYPWAGQTYAIKDQAHSVVQMNHPANPKPTKWSAYRDYGRFGCFFTAPIKNGESLSIKYRFLIAEGAMPGVEVIQKSYDEFAGMTTPSPLPKLTVKPAEAKAAPKPKAPAK